jgi:hypothetical protein
MASKLESRARKSIPDSGIGAGPADDLSLMDSKSRITRLNTTSHITCKLIRHFWAGHELDEGF